MFDAARNLLDNAKKVNTNSLLVEIFKDIDFQDLVLKSNKAQLLDKGEDAAGHKLRSDFARFGQVYANMTINIKKGKGQPTDRVTLKDTGVFYNSFEFLNGAVKANDHKDTGNLTDTWGADILGVSEDSFIEIRKLTIEIIIPIILHAL